MSAILRNSYTKNDGLHHQNCALFNIQIMLFENLLFVHLQCSQQYTEKNLHQLTALVQ